MDGRGVGLRARLLGGGAWALSGSVAEVLLALAENALLARLLLPAELGSYFVVLSVVTVTVSFGQLGMAPTAVRLVASSLARNDERQARRAIRAALGYGTLGALLGAAFLALGPGEWLTIRLLRQPVVPVVLQLAAAWGALWTLRLLITETFRGLHDIRRAALLGKVAVVALSVAFYAALWVGRGRSELREILLLCVLASALGLLAAGWLLRGRMRRLGTRGTATRPPVARTALPLFVNGVLAYVFLNASVWFLGALWDPQRVALYGAATRLSAVVLLPLVIVNAVLPPIIAELHAQGRVDRLELVLRATAGVASVAGLAAGIALALFGGTALRIVYGPFYEEAALALAVVCAGQLVSVVTGSCGVALMMTGNERLFLAITTGVGVVGLLLGYVLILRFGLMGAAAGTAAAMSLQNLLAWAAARAKLGVWTHAGLAGLGEIRRLTWRSSP